MGLKLNLGVARGIITPKLGCMLYGYPSKPIAEGVNDDLTATAHIFQYGNKKLLLVSITVCVLRTDIATELRKMLSEQTNIPYDNIVLSTTHTHSGPALAGMHEMWGGLDREYYEEIFKPVLFSTVKEAFTNISPVTMAMAAGESMVGINRREYDENNNIRLGECPWGILNKKMTVISFKDGEGNIKANLVSYGAHGTASGASKMVTRDWSGVMTDALEEKTGGITSFLLGPEGDVAPRKLLGSTGSIEQSEALGRVAAEDAVRIFETLPEYTDVDMNVAGAVIKVPLYPRMSLEEAESTIKQLESGKVTIASNVKIEQCKKIIQSYQEDYREEEYEEHEQTVFRIGNAAFATFSFELFNEIGIRIEEGVPELNVMNIVCTNGQGGYFPTQTQLCLGGYEINMFKSHGIQSPVDNSDFNVIKETINNINKVK